MKELSIEEKAKHYDEVIKKAESLYKAAEPMSGCNVIIETLFPELKESEDERIRKSIIAIINNYVDNSNTFKPKMLAWLEKQSEQRERLINKACNVLVDCIEDFMLRRMEVWSEECKKQTLENIRKTLEE